MSEKIDPDRPPTVDELVLEACATFASQIGKLAERLAAAYVAGVARGEERDRFVSEYPYPELEAAFRNALAPVVLELDEARADRAKMIDVARGLARARPRAELEAVLVELEAAHTELEDLSVRIRGADAVIAVLVGRAGGEVWIPDHEMRTVIPGATLICDNAGDAFAGGVRLRYVPPSAGIASS